MTARSERLHVTDLLRIDVAAELRKLAEGQLQGMEQVPTELVRRALRGGATGTKTTATGASRRSGAPSAHCRTRPRTTRLRSRSRTRAR